jgi:hypothetical protein
MNKNWKKISFFIHKAQNGLWFSNFKFLFYFIFVMLKRKKLVLIQCGCWSCGHAELSTVCGRHSIGHQSLRVLPHFQAAILFYFLIFNFLGGESSPIRGKIKLNWGIFCRIFSIPRGKKIAQNVIFRKKKSTKIARTAAYNLKKCLRFFYFRIFNIAKSG